MKRDLQAMSGRTFDLLIVGGGITGLCVARDAAMRGLSVALVEKHDFAHATTAASSKLIHGGLRYLQNFELSLVRESLRERRLWSRNAPHMVFPLTFLIPTHGSGMKGRAALSAGLTLYDWLAFDRNRLDDPGKRIPAHRFLSRAEAIEAEPGLEQPGVTGAMAYHDCQMHFPERLALECGLDAAACGALLANYAEVREFIVEAGRVAGARVWDTAGGGEHAIRARMVINASGPWADRLMGALKQGASPRKIMRSKGIHLVTRPLTRGFAVAVPSRGTHFFILPWRGHSLLGTTDTIYDGDPDEFGVTERDIGQFIAVVNEGFPSARLGRADVLYFYGGMRPLVDRESKAARAEGESDSYTASRAAEVIDHETESGISGAISALGGKWTTSRHLAEKVVDLAVRKLGARVRPCATESAPTAGGRTGNFSEFLAMAVEQNPDFSPDTIEHLALHYGTRMEGVLELARAESALRSPVIPGRPEIATEIRFAAREEMARTLEDAIFRRTGLGSLGDPGQAALARAAEIMGAELGWDAGEEVVQMERVRAHYQPLREAAHA